MNVKRTLRWAAGLPALAVIVCLAAASPAAAALEGSKLRKGEPAPDITLKDVDGKTWKLSDLKGKKIVMIDF